MATFSVSLPDIGASKQVVPRTRKLRFGDGYEQRVPDGLNSVTEKWTLNWTVRPRSEIDQIDTFLTDQGGVSWFYWTTPQGRLKKFKCESWSPVFAQDRDCSLSAVFEEVFEQ